MTYNLYHSEQDFKTINVQTISKDKKMFAK